MQGVDTREKGGGRRGSICESGGVGGRKAESGGGVVRGRMALGVRVGGDSGRVGKLTVFDQRHLSKSPGDQGAMYKKTYQPPKTRQIKTKENKTEQKQRKKCFRNLTPESRVLQLHSPLLPCPRKEEKKEHHVITIAQPYTQELSQRRNTRRTGR